MNRPSIFVAALLASGAAYGHHSISAFYDYETPTQLEGTVTAVSWVYASMLLDRLRHHPAAERVAGTLPFTGRLGLGFPLSTRRANASRNIRTGRSLLGTDDFLGRSGLSVPEKSVPSGGYVRSRSRLGVDRSLGT